MDNRNSNRAKRLGITGILLALNVITVFIATVTPVNKLSLYALSSFFIAVAIIEFGIRTGWVFYVSSCLLTLIIVQNKVELLVYLIFFGIYGIVKYYIEKLNKAILEYVIKFCFFNAWLAAVIYFAKQFLLDNISINLPWWIIIAVLEVIFFIYDYVYTLVIIYYNNRLKRILKI